jgi:hypothetical protein
MGNDARVALDSNCLSYLIDALSQGHEPTQDDPLREQRLALVRIMLYDEWGLYVTPMTVIECERIRSLARAQLHDSWLSSIFSELQPLDRPAIEARTLELLAHHPDADDCRVVAECEGAGIRVLLTYDYDLIENLGSRTSVRLLRPVEYWTDLKVERGAAPQSMPAHGNPLASAIWWRW